MTQKQYIELQIGACDKKAEGASALVESHRSKRNCVEVGAALLVACGQEDLANYEMDYWQSKLEEVEG